MKAKAEDTDLQDQYDEAAQLNVREWLFHSKYESDASVFVT